jgi:GxxExxY protein
MIIVDNPVGGQNRAAEHLPQSSQRAQRTIGGYIIQYPKGSQDPQGKRIDMTDTSSEQIGKEIVDSAIKIHKALGPGLLESAYQQVLTYELAQRGLWVECEVLLPIKYAEKKIDAGYRIDMFIEKKVIIENKTVESILAIHEAQLLTYLRLSGCKLGYLLNWNVKLMKNGIQRMVL